MANKLQELGFWSRITSGIAGAIGRLLASINGSKKQAAQITTVTTDVQTGLETGAIILTSVDEAEAALKAERANETEHTSDNSRR